MNTLQDRVNRELRRRNLKCETWYLGKALEAVGLLSLIEDAMGGYAYRHWRDQLKRGTAQCEACDGRGSNFNIQGGPVPVSYVGIDSWSVNGKARYDDLDTGIDFQWWTCHECLGSGSVLFKGDGPNVLYGGLDTGIRASDEQVATVVSSTGTSIGS